MDELYLDREAFRQNIQRLRDFEEGLREYAAYTCAGDGGHGPGARTGGRMETGREVLEEVSLLRACFEAAELEYRRMDRRIEKLWRKALEAEGLRAEPETAARQEQEERTGAARTTEPAEMPAQLELIGSAFAECWRCGAGPVWQDAFRDVADHCREFLMRGSMPAQEAWE